MYVNVGGSTCLPPTITLADELVLLARLLQDSVLDTGEPAQGSEDERVGRQKAEEPPTATPLPVAHSLTLSQRPASLSPAAWTTPPPLPGQTVTSPLPWPGGLWFWHEQLSLPAGEVYPSLSQASLGLSGSLN